MRENLHYLCYIHVLPSSITSLLDAVFTLHSSLSHIYSFGNFNSLCVTFCLPAFPLCVNSLFTLKDMSHYNLRL